MTEYHEGKILADYLDKNRISAYKLGEIIGVSGQSVYDQLPKELMSNSFKLKLRKANIDLFDNQKLTNSIKSQENIDTIPAVAREIITSKDQLINALIKQITALEENIMLLKQHVETKENTWKQIQNIEENTLRMDMRIRDLEKKQKTVKVH